MFFLLRRQLLQSALLLLPFVTLSGQDLFSNLQVGMNEDSVSALLNRHKTGLLIREEQNSEGMTRVYGQASMFDYSADSLVLLTSKNGKLMGYSAYFSYSGSEREQQMVKKIAGILDVAMGKHHGRTDERYSWGHTVDPKNNISAMYQLNPRYLDRLMRFDCFKLSDSFKKE